MTWQVCKNKYPLYNGRGLYICTTPHEFISSTWMLLFPNRLHASILSSQSKILLGSAQQINRIDKDMGNRKIKRTLFSLKLATHKKVDHKCTEYTTYDNSCPNKLICRVNPEYLFPESLSLILSLFFYILLIPSKALYRKWSDRYS